MERWGGGGVGKMNTLSASWENTLQRVKELPTLNKVYLCLVVMVVADTEAAAAAVVLYQSK